MAKTTPLYAPPDLSTPSIDPAHVDVIVKRWEEYTGKKAERAALAPPHNCLKVVKLSPKSTPIL